MHEANKRDWDGIKESMGADQRRGETDGKKWVGERFEVANGNVRTGTDWIRRSHLQSKELFLKTLLKLY